MWSEWTSSSVMGAHSPSWEKSRGFVGQASRGRGRIGFPGISSIHEGGGRAVSASRSQKLGSGSSARLEEGSESGSRTPVPFGDWFWRGWMDTGGSARARTLELWLLWMLDVGSRQFYLVFDVVGVKLRGDKYGDRACSNTFSAQ